MTNDSSSAIKALHLIYMSVEDAKAEALFKEKKKKKKRKATGRPGE